MSEKRPAMQFATLAQQREASTLGMWVFLATEVLFFGGMAMAYFAYRLTYPAGFAEAGAHTQIVIGTANTAILLTSSFAMAAAVHSAGAGGRWPAAALLAITALLGLAFLGLKAVEYAREYQEQLVPGLDFAFAGPHARAAELFFLLYFALTGVHALHLTIGIVLVAVMAVRAAGGAFSKAYSTPVEVVGLYWHFVDVVWIFLFPLIYLAGRSGP